MIDVAAVILENHRGEVLIAKRRQDLTMGGLWEFPGGKIEEGESPRECLVRELKEEMHIDISVGSYVGESIHNYERGPIRLIAYKGKILDGSIQLIDHDEVQWVNPLKLNGINLAPADIPFIKVLIEE